MGKRSTVALLALLVGAAACKSNPGPGGGKADLAGCVGAACNPDNCTTTPTTIVGNVFAPNGLDPVPQVSVWVPTGAVPPPKTGLSCDLCAVGSPPGALSASLTRSDGFFSLGGVPAGDNVTIIAELGRFRRVVHMKVEACKANIVPADPGAHGLKLPSKDQALGPDDTAPHVAVATGDYDQIECVLKRMGFEQFDLYNDRDPGTALPATIGEFSALIADPVKMSAYNIIVVNCTKAQFEDALTPAALANLEAYVGSGGRLYATDWAYDVINQVPQFAPYMCFVSGGVDGPAPMATCGTTPGAPRAAHSTAAYDTGAQITDQGLLDWITQIPNTLVNMQVPIRFNFVVVNQVVSDMAHQSKVYAKGLAEDPLALPMFSKGVRPLTATFDYKQCGRVHYSTYNTEPSDVVMDTPAARYPMCGMRTDFNPQERILEYLIFEVAQCITPVL
jgi:hypothetical protein